jgi:uroporphyrinogen-III decarboxylase
MESADRQAGVYGLPAVSIPCALMYVHQLFGSEALALWSMLDRDRLTRVFDLLKARVLDYVEYILREGAGPVLSYGGPELAVPPLMSPKDFHDFVTVMDKPVHELAHSHGRYTWIHCHGTLDKVLEEFLEIGADVVEPLEAPPGGDVELADAKRRIGDRIVIMGNMPYEAIISWPKDRIEERVKADCEAAMAGGGYIMMPCASPFEPVLTDEAFEGFKAYILAGRKYGRYGRSS